MLHLDVHRHAVARQVERDVGAILLPWRRIEQRHHHLARRAQQGQGAADGAAGFGAAVPGHQHALAHAREMPGIGDEQDRAR